MVLDMVVMVITDITITGGIGKGDEGMKKEEKEGKEKQDKSYKYI